MTGYSLRVGEGWRAGEQLVVAYLAEYRGIVAGKHCERRELIFSVSSPEQDCQLYTQTL